MKKFFCALLMGLTLLFGTILPAAASQGTTPEGADPIESVFNRDEQERTKAVGLLESLFGDRAETVDIIVLLTLLSLLPSLLLMLTSFTRTVIVLSFVRNAIGLQQMPPNQVVVGLALFLTFFVMAPVFTEIKETAYEPYIAEEIEVDEALTTAMKPIRSYMLSNTVKEDLVMFLQYSNTEIPEELPVTDPDDPMAAYDYVPDHVLIPAFILSEIKHAFFIGFFLYIPFIVIDMVVASTLMAMGMMMLPPATISLPFKILLFVMVDGWVLVVQSLFNSIHMVFFP